MMKEKLCILWKKTKKLFSEHKELWLIVLLPVYLLYFFIAEKVVPSTPGSYWVSYVPEDDHIPFLPFFVIFYMLWYPLLVGTGLLSIVREPKIFTRYMIMLLGSFFLCVTFCIIFPNGQDLRVDLSTQPHNLFTALIGSLYSSDTNTNVLPSMHVVGCIVCIYSAYENPRSKRWQRIVIVVLGVLISASTVFIKQHSILDVYTGVGYGLVLGAIFYGKRIRTALTRKKVATQPVLEEPTVTASENAVEQAAKASSLKATEEKSEEIASTDTEILF